MENYAPIPILTWGFERSNTVASPRTPLGSLTKTCCTGLTPRCCRSASRVVRRNGASDRVKVAMLVHVYTTPENRMARSEWRGEC